MSSERDPERTDLRSLRSIMETPLLDERKWAKVPTIPADAFIIDLEDSVVPQAKEVARGRLREVLADPDFFDGRLVIPRSNNIATPWGLEDIAAVAELDVDVMLYPKATGTCEVREVLRILRDAGSRADVVPIIETAGALRDVGEIAQIEGVRGLFTGIGDLSVDAGVPFHLNGEINPVLARARDSVAFAAAAAQISSTDTVYARNIRDENDVREAILEGRNRGFTSLVTFYPPHVAMINQHLAPSAEEIADARWIVERYEQEQAEGRPAFVTETGRTVLLLDYVRAVRLLESVAPAVGATS